MTAVLAKRDGPSVGITIARITNDLSSVRNWVSMGIAPVTVGLPLIVGTTVALWLLSPPLAVAMALLTRPAFDKARTLRRKRGRLSAQVSDTVAATVSSGPPAAKGEKSNRFNGWVAR